MKLVKSLLLLTGLSIALSSCIVAGPGYYRPRYHHPHPHYYRSGPRW